ncbi:hypothetical protein RFI_11832 [Reticulomyxa filosa]|uniref:RGS domain-containing protein n=1 Tax=Reticulomyxa filosa TaxID=46433 RepID=X6NH48_RETFI|nr:hypothetical protein RFI_11832 [Reticulomyxa filosa]|eukprot:ETO25306.1 hypothetical protein RFI_11832 [Reticulomyxa filosa]
MDRIFTLTMGFMMGLGLDQLPQFCMKFSMSEATKSDMKWLNSQEETIHDPTGFQYLCRFLEVHSCSEYVWFLKIYLEFEYAMSDKQRLVIARKMVDCCMTPGEPFEINISYEMREEVCLTQRKNFFLQCAKNVKELNARFHRGEEVIVPPDMFDFVYKEIKKLIRDNYWLAFEKMCLTMSK